MGVGVVRVVREQFLSMREVRDESENCTARLNAIIHGDMTRTNLV